MTFKQVLGVYKTMRKGRCFYPSRKVLWKNRHRLIRELGIGQEFPSDVSGDGPRKRKFNEDSYDPEQEKRKKRKMYNARRSRIADNAKQNAKRSKTDIQANNAKQNPKRSKSDRQADNAKQHPKRSKSDRQADNAKQHPKRSKTDRKADNAKQNPKRSTTDR